MNLTEQILNYLQAYGPSSAALLAGHLQCPESALEHDLQTLLEQGLLRQQTLLYHPCPWPLWDLSAAAARTRRAGRRVRGSSLQLDHHLGLQYLHLQARRQGARQWCSGRLCRLWIDAQTPPWRKIPDALYTSAEGQRWAVELELVGKARWRYQEAWNAYAELLHGQQIDGVLYITPQALYARLQRIFAGIEHIDLYGRCLALPTFLRQRFCVQTLESWSQNSA